jgi:AAHS family cis,cis-muconate transporter-like MFS transporter
MEEPEGGQLSGLPLGALHLHRFSSPTVVLLGVVGLSAGFGQFGAVAALGEVAKSFGHLSSGATIADQAGLSGTELGIGLAILRFASFGGLFLTSLADRLGRRRSLLWNCSLGLLVTAAAALSPSYWAFVAIFALGRPLLSTASALTQVMAAEQTDAKNRARAIAVVSGGYGLGSGLTALVHSLFGSAVGFRLLFALALVPLVVIAPLARRISEPDRFTLEVPHPERSRLALGAIAADHRLRLAVVLGLAFAVAFMAGPVNSFVFLYGENVLKVSGSTMAIFVVAAGATGLLGLVAGQRFADRFGRRPTGALAMIAMALCSALTYSGSKAGLGVGYVLGIGGASVFAPAAGALSNEVFPTEVRASVAGWLIAASVAGAIGGLLSFGAIADIGNAFSTGALVVAGVALVGTALFALLPETAGLEPEVVPPSRSR